MSNNKSFSELFDDLNSSETMKGNILEAIKRMIEVQDKLIANANRRIEIKDKLIVNANRRIEIKDILIDALKDENERLRDELSRIEFPDTTGQ